MERKNIEIFVGLFVLTGLVVCAWLIIEFGKVGQIFQKTYPIYVEFENGNGLIKGAQVRYTGTLVGRVADMPVLKTDPQGNQYVLAQLNIDEGIKILKGSTITVGQSGFLGDNYVNIDPPKMTEGQPIVFLPHEETLRGSRPADLAALTSEGKELMEQLRKITTQLETTTSNINMVLTPQTATNINLTLENIRDTTGHVKNFTSHINDPKSPLNEILRNKETGANINAFIYNIRKRGILFYGDVYDRDKAQEKPHKAKSSK